MPRNVLRDGNQVKFETGEKLYHYPVKALWSCSHIFTLKLFTGTEEFYMQYKKPVYKQQQLFFLLKALIQKEDDLGLKSKVSYFQKTSFQLCNLMRIFNISLEETVKNERKEKIKVDRTAWFNR